MQTGILCFMFMLPFAFRISKIIRDAMHAAKALAGPIQLELLEQIAKIFNQQLKAFIFHEFTLTEARV